MSEDLHSGCTPLTEARGLHRLLSTGFTIEQIRALIAVPPRIERALRSYARENARDACWIEAALKFRQAVALAFERLVREGSPVTDLPKIEEAELDVTEETYAAAGVTQMSVFGNGEQKHCVLAQAVFLGSPQENLELLTGHVREASAHGLLDEVVANVGANRDYLRTITREFLVQLIVQMFSAGIVCLKHEGFLEEREWRAIHTPKRWPSTLMESSTEVVAGVPQVVYKVPLDGSVSPMIADLDFAQVFDRLIVGPLHTPGRFTVRSSKRLNWQEYLTLMTESLFPAYPFVLEWASRS